MALTQWASPPGLEQRISKAGPVAYRGGGEHVVKRDALLNSRNYPLSTGTSSFFAAAWPSTESVPEFMGSGNHRGGFTSALIFR